MDPNEFHLGDSDVEQEIESDEDDLEYYDGEGFNFGTLYVYCLLRGYGADPDSIVKYKIC